MVTVNKITYVGTRGVLELVGLSTDSLPKDTIEGHKITNGSTIFMMDTPNIVGIFDEENHDWRDTSDGSVI